MKERNRDQAWRMIVGFDRHRPTSDDIQMPTRRGNVGGRRSEASGFPARPGGVMPRHDTFLDEPDADKSLALLAELLSPPVVVVVGLSSARLLDRAEARQGLGGIQRFATLGSATQSAAVSRGWV